MYLFIEKSKFTNPYLVLVSKTTRKVYDPTATVVNGYRPLQIPATVTYANCAIAPSDYCDAVGLTVFQMPSDCPPDQYLGRISDNAAPDATDEIKKCLDINWGATEGFREVPVQTPTY